MNWLRSKKNRFFARAFVNRVWASYFNVGIVNPADDLSLANPPSNAELLDYLADGFVKHGYDMKWLHREIVNSRTYQLSWRPNDTNRLDQHNFSHAVLRRLPAEVAYDAVREATGSDVTVAKMLTDWRDRAIGIPGSGRRAARGASSYALSVFGRSVRQSNCDCDRSNEPSLLQTVFLRNDDEVLAMVGDARDGWVAQIANELVPRTKPARPKSSAARPAGRRCQAGQRLTPTLAERMSVKPAKPAATVTAKKIASLPPLRPEQKARQIARLSERIKQLQTAGKTEQVEAAHRSTRRVEAASGGGRARSEKPARARLWPRGLRRRRCGRPENAARADGLPPHAQPLSGRSRADAGPGLFERFRQRVRRPPRFAVGLGEHGRIYCESLNGKLDPAPAPYSPPGKLAFKEL